MRDCLELQEDSKRQRRREAELNVLALKMGNPLPFPPADKKEEADPHGVDQHAPGAKLDAGKLRPNLVRAGFINALQEVWKDGTYGAVKYSDNGWKDVPNAINRYLDAGDRHFDKYLQGKELYDPESGVHHLGAAIWNLLAVLELELTKNDKT